jgi:avirulence protein
MPRPGGIDDRLAHPGLQRRAADPASRPATLAARVSLHGAAMAAPAAHVEEPPEAPSAAAIDLEALNGSAQDGHLARSALQLALDRPGQTIELELALHGRSPPAHPPPDRTLSLRYQPGTGVALSTSAPSAGALSFGIRDPSVLGAQADIIAGLLDRVSSLDRFQVTRVRVDPPPVRTGLPGPSPASGLTDEEQSLVGVARWPDAACNREHDPRQQAYGRSFREASRDAGAQLAQGRIRSLRELWTYAQDWRGRQVATAQDDRRFGLGSQRRSDGVGSSDMTALVGPYAYLRDRYKPRTDGVLEYPERISRRYAIHDAIDGQRIALSSISIRTHWDEASARKFLASRRQEAEPSDAPPPFRINHTSPANAQRIMAHAESLFTRALAPTLPPSEALATLGELHWWIAQAMPDSRGSAAKAELCVRALAQARGMDLPPFAHGVIPDLEAITRLREDFVAHYASLFSRTPVQ